MKKYIAAALTLLSTSAMADIAVIVHPSNQSEFDNEMLVRIFTGKARSFSNGQIVVPVNLREGDEITNQFNAKVLSKNPNQLKAYWSKLVFTGKGTPPKEVNNSKEVLELVSTNPSIIGYVDAEQVDESVKVVGRF